MSGAKTQSRDPRGARRRLLIAAGLAVVFIAGGASVTRWTRMAPPEPPEAVAAAPVPEVLPPTELPLRLLGTRVESEPGRSVAIVADAEQAEPQLVHEGETLAHRGGARLARIESDHVVLEVGGRLEALRLTPDPPPDPTPGEPAGTDRPDPTPGEPAGTDRPAP